MYANLWVHTSIIYADNRHHSFPLRCAWMRVLLSITSVVTASFWVLGGTLFIDSFCGIRASLGQAGYLGHPLPVPPRMGSESSMHKFLLFGEESHPPRHLRSPQRRNVQMPWKQPGDIITLDGFIINLLTCKPGNGQASPVWCWVTPRSSYILFTG